MVDPVGAPGEAMGAAGRKGALYTGRGPVCGTIIRGGCRVGRAGALGEAGLAAMVDPCAAGAVGLGVVMPGAVELTCTGGATGGGTAGRGAAGGTGATAGDVCCTGGAGAVNVGLGVEVGTTNLGAVAAGGAGGFGAAIPEAGGGGETMGLVSLGRWAGAGGASTGVCCLLMMAFRASPGFEI